MAEQILYRKPVTGFVNEAKKQRAIKEQVDEYKIKQEEARVKGQKLPPFVLDEARMKEQYIKFGGLYIPTEIEAKAEALRLKTEAEVEAKAKAEAEAAAKAEERAKIRAEVEAELKITKYV